VVRWNGQTNGTLYTEEVLRFCQRWQVNFGLSFDGPRGVNDRHRVDHAGRSSFDAVERAVQLLSSPVGRPLWGGVLAVIDLRSDPGETYGYLRDLQPPSIDFLLPLGHHDLRPPGKVDRLDTTPYADWLLQVFELWYSERPQPIRMRRFRDIVALHLGATKSSEEWGLQPVDFIVVETDGSIEAVDTLKITYPGACDLGMDIFRHSFDDALSSPKVLERQRRWLNLCDVCQRCDVVGVCGGGYFPQRYSNAAKFANPSVYCADLMKLIRTISSRVDRDLRQVSTSVERQA
jgi:uncharacterized protein